MKTRYSLLTIAMMTAFSQYAQADLREQCLLGVPHFQGEEAFTKGILGHLDANVMERLHFPEIHCHLHLPAPA